MMNLSSILKREDLQLLLNYEIELEDIIYVHDWFKKNKGNIPLEHISRFKSKKDK